MKMIHMIILTGLMFLAGCDNMAGYAVQLYHEPPIIEDPIEDPIVEDPIEPPIIEDPIEDPIIEDPIEDPIVEDPEIPDYVEITQEECNPETDDEKCEGNVMVYCGGLGIGQLIRVDCDKYYQRRLEEGTWTDTENRFKCVTQFDGKRVGASCYDEKGVEEACTPDESGLLDS